MDERLEQYINPGFIYNFWSNPDSIRTREDAFRYGVNCVSLAHLALKDLFNYQLPSQLGCFELYSDLEHFLSVDGVDDMQIGDLVWFGVPEPKITIEEFVPYYNQGSLTNWSDFPVKHVAIYTGEFDDDYLLLHSTHTERGNSVWPLHKFTKYHRYRKIYNISRLIIGETRERLV